MKLVKEREKVNAFLKDELIVKKGLDSIDITNGIDWNYQHHNNANTYQTYLHSLGIVTDLLKVYKVDNEEHLLQYASEVILDWYEKDHTKGNNYAWKEHPVSSRINNIIEFQENVNKYKIPIDIFDSILNTHCDYLNNEDNYKSNNHGLMMDYSLLLASKYIKSDEKKNMYTDKALYRVRYFLYRDFTRKGVHLENSPEYHRLVLIILKKIEKVAKDRNLKLGQNETEIIKLAQKYKNQIILPNLLYPLIGDTGTIHDKRIKKNYNNFLDREAGIAVLLNKNINYPEKSAMLTFKSGYQSKTHKHLDDLSSTFYIDGNEVLIDSGKYSYNVNDPIRKHIISPYAHNTICLKEKNYKLTNPIKDQFKLRITKFVSKPDYKIVTGMNKLYKEVSLTRHNILTKENIYIIVDRIIATNKESIIQNFNLNENAEVSKIDELTYEIKINENSYILKTFERYNTSIRSEIRKGFVSREFTHYTSNSRIVFKQNSKNATYITAIFDKGLLSDIENMSLVRNTLKYSIGSKYFNIDL